MEDMRANDNGGPGASRCRARTDLPVLATILAALFAAGCRSNADLRGAIAQISAGGLSTCAVKTDGTLWCWGANHYGEVGVGTHCGSDQPFKPEDCGEATPVEVMALGADVAEVSAGGTHTCAVRTDGTLWCWGYNGDYSVGDGTTVDRYAPVQVTALGNSVAHVDAHALCALKTDATLWCWGGPAPLPVQITALGNDVTQAADGCARKMDGTLWCSFNLWSPKPQQVKELGNSVVEVAGAGSYCAVKTDGTLWCWGDKGFELGIGPECPFDPDGKGPGCPKAPPTQIAALENDVSDVAVGDVVCVRKRDGSLWCWGYNQLGQLGDGTTVERHAPVEVTGLGKIVAQASVGSGHTCAITNDGSLWCWGDNYFGELGIGCV